MVKCYINNRKTNGYKYYYGIIRKDIILEEEAGEAGFPPKSS
jgi:hypothetical protein